MPRPERTAAILVAAGRGLRAGAGGPKQYREIGGQTRPAVCSDREGRMTFGNAPQRLGYIPAA